MGLEEELAELTEFLKNIGDDAYVVARSIQNYLFGEIKGNDVLLSKEERQRLIQVMNDHQLLVFDDCACSCGWWEKGITHAEHVINEFEKGWNG